MIAISKAMSVDRPTGCPAESQQAAVVDGPHDRTPNEHSESPQGSQSKSREHEAELLSALTAIGRRLGVEFRRPRRPIGADQREDAIEAIAAASGVRCRRVNLSGPWWKSDSGPLLGFVEGNDSEHPVALLPRKNGGYKAVDPRDGESWPVDEKTACRLAPHAVQFYRPLPASVRDLRGLARYGIAGQSRPIAWIGVLASAAMVLTMFAAQATKLLVDVVVPGADLSLAAHLALGLFAAAIGHAVFHLAQGLAATRLEATITADVQSAVWDRVLKLPAHFFRRFAPGELANRAMMATELSLEVGGMTLQSLLIGSTSMLSLLLLFYYNAGLAWFAACLIVIYLLALGWIGSRIRRHAVQREQARVRLFGFSVQLVEGISKIRVAAAEGRCFDQWRRRYGCQLGPMDRVLAQYDLGALTGKMLTPIGLLVVFGLSAGRLHPTDQVDGPALATGDFLGFYVAFGMLLAGLTRAGDVYLDLADSLSKGRLMSPLLDEPTEVDERRIDPGVLAGRVDLDNVTFRYCGDGPVVLDGVSLRAEPGEFVAIVGPSGGGKTTILRMLLGFETTSGGSVRIDGRDLTTLDLAAVRRQMGVVLQSDRVTAGTIFENITIGCAATMDDAWRAAEEAGLADDIERMPMKLHTLVSEGGGNLSGGQRQRLLIARALIRKPRMLVLDEATSALDNRTQEIVSQSIRRRGITRITVAHRLETVRGADRIYVLDSGRVVEAGAFADLISRNGRLRQLMSRQMA